MYKLRIYHEFGKNKGNLKNEEFFDSYAKMVSRYKKFGNIKPTAWELVNNEWKRLEGF